MGAVNMARVNLIVDKASVGKLRKLLGTHSDSETVYEIPREDDWARGGILVERFTRFRGHAQVRDHFRDILVVLAAVNRGAVLVSSDAHIANWGKLLKRQGKTLRLKIL